VKDNGRIDGVVDGGDDRVKIIMPDDSRCRRAASISAESTGLEQEARLHEYKRAAALAFIPRQQAQPHRHVRRPKPKHRHHHRRQELSRRAAGAGRSRHRRGGPTSSASAFKIGLPWPLDRGICAISPLGLDLIIVVEEKRSLIEVQVARSSTARRATSRRRRQEGREGDWLFPAKGALDPNDIAIAIGERILRGIGRIRAMRGSVAAEAGAGDAGATTSRRTPYFCSGCPHNTSTVVPEGSRAYAGIGCHYMAQWMDRKTEGFTQMGGEGANWVGEAPFSKRKHVFQNLGDGTYNHSGSLAIRA
jgi:indolepyruvate ferredoxin oxidoreductase